MANYPAWLGEDRAKLEHGIRRRRLGKVAEYLQREIENMGIDDTGRLVRSIRVNEKAGTVTMTAPYGKWVNEGRTPGAKMPPYSPIRRWVGHKLGITEQSRARSVAWAVMKKIQKQGIPGKWVLERAWKRASG